MNLDDLRPCDGCGGQVNPTFFRVRIEHMVVNQTAARQRFGMEQFFGSPKLASVFDAYGDQAVRAATHAELRLCVACFCDGSAIVGTWQKVTRAEVESLRQARQGDRAGLLREEATPLPPAATKDIAP